MMPGLRLVFVCVGVVDGWLGLVCRGGVEDEDDLVSNFGDR